MKPRLRIIDGQPVAVEPLPPTDAAGKRQRALEIARKRFGRPFAHQPGTDWQPRPTRLLSEWLARRTTGKTA